MTIGVTQKKGDSMPRLFSVRPPADRFEETRFELLALDVGLVTIEVIIFIYLACCRFLVLGVKAFYFPENNLIISCPEDPHVTCRNY